MPKAVIKKRRVFFKCRIKTDNVLKVSLTKKELSYKLFPNLKLCLKVTYNVEGLARGWYSMNYSPERQTSNEPKTEDNYKSRTKNVVPGTTDEQQTKADFIPSVSVEASPCYS
jgi:hypothetical protein